jgi:DNA replication protein DnaC
VPPELGKEAIEDCSFIGERQSLVLYGGVGNGKTHMAIACGMAACEHGLATILTTVSDLVMRMCTAEDTGTLERVFHEVVRADLVILGELPADRRGARLLFQVISKCYKRRSLIITTSLEFLRWGSVLTDELMAAAVIERIIHHGHLIVFDESTKKMERSPMTHQVSFG